MNCKQQIGEGEKSQSFISGCHLKLFNTLLIKIIKFLNSIYQGDIA